MNAEAEVRMVEKDKDEPSNPRGRPPGDMRQLLPISPDEEITCHTRFSVQDANRQLTTAIARTLEGDLVQVRRAIEALPPSHPRRRLLLSNFREAVALLQDLPGILAR